MALVADRVKETSTTTGTGTLTLAGAATTFRTFASVFAVGVQVYYAIVHQSADEWEVGIGTLASSSTLSRDRILSSSNSNAAVSFSAGTKDVFVTNPATEIQDKGLITALRSGLAGN